MKTFVPPIFQSFQFEPFQFVDDVFVLLGVDATLGVEFENIQGSEMSAGYSKTLWMNI